MDAWFDLFFFVIGLAAIEETIYRLTRKRRKSAPQLRSRIG
jgi:hypothetical protein